MKRSHLALAIAGLLASSTSFAAIDATETTIVGGPLLFAKGLPTSSTSVAKIPVVGTGTNGDGLDVILPVGFSIPAGATQFIRLDLSGGATFGVEPGCATSSTIVACNKRGVSAIGKSFATFSIKASTNSDILPASELTIGFSTLSGVTNGPITGAGIRVPNTDNNVTLTYTLHNNDVSADKGITGEGVLQTATKTVPYVSFVDAITANFSGFKQNDPASTSGNFAFASELFSDVGAEFKKFYNVGEPVQLGQVLLTVNTDVFLNTGDADNNTAVMVASDGSNLLGTGSTLVVSGNFSFLQDVTNGEPSGKYDSAGSRVTLKSGGANDNRQCLGTDIAVGGTTVTADKVTFKLDGGGAFVGTSMSLCISPNAASIIEGSDVSISFNPVGDENLKLNAVTFDKFAKISQNGTVLDSPYLSTNPNYINRLILTNTSGKPLKYQVLQVVTDAGKIIPLNAANSTGNIPASANLFLKVEDLITDAANVSPGRVAVRISVTGSNKAVQGVAQTIKRKNVINGGAGDLQTVPFVRKCGGSGCN